MIAEMYSGEEGGILPPPKFLSQVLKPDLLLPS